MREPIASGFLLEEVDSVLCTEGSERLVVLLETCFLVCFNIAGVFGGIGDRDEYGRSSSLRSKEEAWEPGKHCDRRDCGSSAVEKPYTCAIQKMLVSAIKIPAMIARPLQAILEWGALGPGISHQLKRLTRKGMVR